MALDCVEIGTEFLDLRTVSREFGLAALRLPVAHNQRGHAQGRGDNQSPAGCCEELQSDLKRGLKIYVSVDAVNSSAQECVEGAQGLSNDRGVGQ